MEDYNFWQDLFDTYQSTADWIKALWIVSVPTFALGVLALFLHYRLALAQVHLRSLDGRADDDVAQRFRRVLLGTKGFALLKGGSTEPKDSSVSVRDTRNGSPG